MKLGFYFVSAIVAVGFCGVRQAAAFPRVVSLPPHTISAPPISSIPALLGTWQDKYCLLLPSGITPFEAVSDTVTFRADGTFTQVIDKATGRLNKTGRYAVNGSHLTLSYLAGPVEPLQYEFSRKGEGFELHPAGSGKVVALFPDRGRS